MAKLLSNRFNTEVVPESYVFPLEKRPGKLVALPCETIPVVDLKGGDGHDQTEIIRQILEASQEFGFFQVINHGILEKTMDDMMDVAKEFFELPVEDHASLYSDDRREPIRLSTSIDYKKEEIHYWRDRLTHPCHPIEEFMHLWPEKPTRYRKVAQSYSVEMRRLGLRLMELICEGLGLEWGYFDEELSKVQNMAINRYPPCPDPSLTLGLPKHSDPNLITLLLQGDVAGLQVFKGGEWIAVEPIPNAFVVNIGYQLQIISNGRLRSAEHRVVTNSTIARTTIVTFFNPTMECIIEPAPPMTNAHSPPLYRAVKYKDFHNTHIAMIIGGSEGALERFKLQP